MKYEAVIFDLDGTLLDTIEDLAGSMNAVLYALGFPVHDTDSYRYFVGTGVRNLVRKALPEDFRSDKMVDNGVAAMLNEYKKRWDNKTRPYEGIPEMLGSLAGLGIRMSILSNKPHELTLKAVNALLPNWRFECVFGDRKGVPKKPDPSSALEIANIMDIPTEKFLYMGDSGTDMETARAAGMYPVGVKWGFRKPEELISSGAKKIIDKPQELIGIIADNT
jgi:phosphoglycolate phosphatase